MHLRRKNKTAREKLWKSQFAQMDSWKSAYNMCKQQIITVFVYSQYKIQSNILCFSIFPWQNIGKINYWRSYMPSFFFRTGWRCFELNADSWKERNFRGLGEGSLHTHWSKKKITNEDAKYRYGVSGPQIV